MAFGGWPLAAAQTGSELQVRAISGCDKQRRRLRELGMLEGRRIRVVASGDPMICEVGDGRFGVCRRLARCVLVELASESTLARSA